MLQGLAATSASNISVAADADAEDLTIATTGSAGDVIINSADDLSTTFVADGQWVFTGSSNTTTAGIFDLNLTSNTTGNIGFNLDYSVPDNAGAGPTGSNAAVINVTATDANATNIRGLTLNQISDAGTVDALILLDNADVTASSLTDGIRITSSGVNLGITDAIDVSDANLTNAINVGANTILGTDAVIDFTDFDVIAAINIANLTSADGTVIERAIQIGNTWDSNLFFADTSTQIQVSNTGTIV